MKLLILVVIFTLLNLAPAIGKERNKDFKEFKDKFKKKYKNEKDEDFREEVFLKTLDKIQRQNEKFKKKESLYDMAVNEFSDLTAEEFIQKHTGRKEIHKEQRKKRETMEWTNLRSVNKRSAPPPGQIDWRTQGYVTPVQNQGSCGSCWAFGNVVAAEGAYKKNFGELINFSEQQLVDCSTADNGCQGGLMTGSFYYYMTKGPMTDQQYPYKATRGTCKDVSGQPTVKHFYDALTYNETLLKVLVGNYGPCAVALNGYEIMSYSSGIYDNVGCDKYGNHAVAAVGYGTENGVDYWIVKNSWGAGWGENGYIRLLRDKNICGFPEEIMLPSFATEGLPEVCTELQYQTDPLWGVPPETTNC